MFIQNEGAISWRAIRQPTVATSTTEAEYMALYTAAQEAIWLQRLYQELKIVKDEAILINQDNQGCIALSKNEMCQQRTKHIDIKFHFVRESVLMKKIFLKYVESNNMVADILTKNLPVKMFEIQRERMGVKTNDMQKIMSRESVKE